MRTYEDRDDFLTKVRCDHCKVGVQYQLASKLVVRDQRDNEIEYYGHEKCMEALQEQLQ